MKKKIKFILVITWMIVIFMFSNQVATDSTKLTKQITSDVIDVIDKEITTETREEIQQSIFVPLRKSAHFFVYFVLGMLIYTLLKEYMPKYKFRLSIVLVVLYAITDEFHQMFIPGRSASYIDVLIDTAGGLTGASVMAIRYKIKHRIRSKKEIKKR